VVSKPVSVIFTCPHYDTAGAAMKCDQVLQY